MEYFGAPSATATPQDEEPSTSSATYVALQMSDPEDEDPIAATSGVIVCSLSVCVLHNIPLQWMLRITNKNANVCS